MRPATGTPIRVRGSPVAIAVARSPVAFPARPTTATRHAQRRSASNPTAVTAIVAESAAMPTIATGPSERGRDLSAGARSEDEEGGEGMKRAARSWTRSSLTLM